MHSSVHGVSVEYLLSTAERRRGYYAVVFDGRGSLWLFQPLTQSTIFKKQYILFLSNKTTLFVCLLQDNTISMEHLSFTTESRRRLEQLVLYVRALQLLSSSISLAKVEVARGKLHVQSSSAVKHSRCSVCHTQCLLQSGRWQPSV